MPLLSLNPKTLNTNPYYDGATGHRGTEVQRLSGSVLPPDSWNAGEKACVWGFRFTVLGEGFRVVIRASFGV